LYLFVLLSTIHAMTPSKGVVQVWVDKQQIRSVALGRLSEEYSIPLYFQLPMAREWGTGISLSSDMILTNYHVVQGAKALGVQTPTSEIVSAQIVQVLPDLDLAWIQLEEDLGLEVWTSEMDISLNERIWTGGFASKLEWSEKEALLKDIGRIDILSDEKQHFMVIDQVVDTGYSGGPVWNQEQKLVGMMTATNFEKQESYFISMKEVAAAWDESQKRKVISWGDLGIEVSGEKIIRVNPYSPARSLPLGRIEELNGKELRPELLEAEFERFAVGENLELKIDGVEYSLQVESFSDWGPGSGDSCQWKQASLLREGEHWRIVSLEDSSDLLRMGARPNDLLQITETCQNINNTSKRIIPIIRDQHSYYLVLSKD
jgi:hypothetical protein